ncbi:hypothetical protein [Aquitalea denitrificans]|uniref:hypothetical protein n=1 Tax=Aquitalea denitrificans TaxID=519081 RepID=UPI00196B2D41|nr:hypothetical protein [Aquitalea denitrificans]
MQEGAIELMPVSDSQLYGFRYVNDHPGNTFRNMLTVMAFGALADVASGFSWRLSEFTIVTALRTAATSTWVAGSADPKRPITDNPGRLCRAKQQTLKYLANQS